MMLAIDARREKCSTDLAETVRKASLEDFLHFSCGGCGGGSRQESRGLNVGPVLNAGRGDGVQNGLCLLKIKIKG